AIAHWFSTWIGPTPLALSLALGIVSGQTFDLLRERLERSRLHHQFRRFVSRDVADSLVNDPSIYQHAALGRKRRVVVMFSDLRGFTSLSEKITPEQLFAQLNEYLSAMVKIIFAHGGTLDKFIGDAILAHWGALENGDETTFSNSALAAAQAMTAGLDELNSSWKSRGLPELEMGIGLHLGDVLAGEIGSEQRTEFGVIGDAVNLASRLEGLTKVFGCPYLASRHFIAALPPANINHLHRIAKVRVKGRQEPLDVWAPACCEAAKPSFAQALELFESGEFDNAVEFLEEYLKQFIDDHTARHLLEKTHLFSKTRPTDWQGIIEFSDK
ncbi:MAG: adenylate/guanylate cyclase domain-containing protein, partial [Armatimonadetes bacterium]|nr:adenylate/guanylate cyclase domain-containing protein [Akkermansiaceae bacterium]